MKLKLKLRLRRNKKAKAKQEIWIYKDGEYEQENVVAERLMRLIYDTPVGGATLPFLVKRKALSRLYGIYCRTRHSARKIPKFITKYQVDMTGTSGDYKNFAEFFSRERDDVIFPEQADVLGSPCDGLASVYTDIDPAMLIAAKGCTFSLGELLRDDDLAQLYRGGTMLRIRLTPAHYHRMHFFDDGTITDSRLIRGDLYSVSPLAIKRIVRLYCRNKRALITFESANFGKVMLVEVGATFVGSIVHCFENGDTVSRAQMASYFLPGGSLLLAFFRQDTFAPDPNLVAQTAQGYETRVMVGEALGTGRQ
ncbi:MAG: phosphatidylserine decarboxylase [Defluviitaleaceae bacterium]|nr:phosphatidylserine decarboxylase [Defluviitaleaceae bacterium]